MIKNFEIKRLRLLVLLVLLSSFSIAPVQARLMSPVTLPLGYVIAMNGRTYIKITEDNKWMDTEKWKTVSNLTMQGWDDCSSLMTPIGANFTQGPTLIDVRDNKTYEIRKFVDGKCWMVDNLMYGGATDACDSKNDFLGYGAATPSNRFGPGTYGDCRDPRVGGIDPCIDGSTVCGYHYSWQAVMQESSAYYNTTYNGPTTNVQGLCPEGWHLPIGGNGGDFVILNAAVGSSAASFWQNGGWKGVFSSFCDCSGGSTNQVGLNSYLWTSKHETLTYAYYVFFAANKTYLTESGHKCWGFSVRCVKD